MRNINRIYLCIACLSFLVVISCSDEESPERPVPKIYFTPIDISTSVEQEKLEVTILTYYEELGQKLIDIEKETVLKKWPDGNKIEIHKIAVDWSGTDTYGEIPRAHIKVRPADELEDGWFYMCIENIPMGFEILDGPAAYYDDKHGVGARFSCESSPKVRSIEICNKYGKSKIYIETSENVKGNCNVEEVIEVREDYEIVNCIGQNTVNQQEIDVIELECTEMRSDTRKEVKIFPCYQSITGEPLVEEGGFKKFTMTENDMTLVDKDCWMYKINFENEWNIE